MKLIFCWLTAALAAPSVAPAGDCRAVKPVVVVQEKVVQEVISPVVAVFQAVAIPVYSAVYSPAVAYPPSYAPPVAAYAPSVAPYAGGGYGGVPAAGVAQGFAQGAATGIAGGLQSAALPQRAAGVPGGFGQQGALAASDDLAAAVRLLASEVRAINARMDRMEGRPATMPLADQAQGQPAPAFNQGQAAPAPQAPERLTALLSQHCAACHDRSKAAASGKGIVLLEGGRLASISPELGEAMYKAVLSGSMPKGGRMPAEERLELLALFAGPGK